MQIDVRELQSSAKPRTKRRSDRRGFVLLMALVLIALAGMILTGIARHSVLMSLESQASRADLQSRWAKVFLSRALLSNPERLMSRHHANNGRKETQRALSQTIELGDTSFLVLLDDENRKLNLNRLRIIAGTQKTVELIYRFGGAGSRVQLKPAPSARLGTGEFDSWGHVFNLSAADNVESQYEQIQPVSRYMTCWGNAKVNVHRCGDDVLHLLGELAAGPITANRIVELRDAEPELGVDDLVAKLEIDRRKQALLKSWLSDDSNCYSLWIRPTRRQSSLDLYVREFFGSDSHTVKHFRW